MAQLVRTATRKDNILDLVLTTNDKLIADIEIGPLLENSDHNIVKFKIQTLHYVHRSRKTTFNYRKANYPAMTNALSRINWEELLDTLNIEEAWQAFKSICFELIEKHVPVSNFERKN